MSDLERLSFSREFLRPALLLLIVGNLPALSIPAIAHVSPAFFSNHPHGSRTAYYVMLTWALFTLITACVIVGAGVFEKLQKRRQVADTR
jgi:hypothetical protein